MSENSTSAGETTAVVPEHHAVLPADFDLDAAISGAKRPERTVSVITRADLRARLDEIATEVERARPAEDGERGMDEDSAESLLEEFRAVREQMLASAIPFRLRGITEGEARAAVKAAKADGVPVTGDDVDPRAVAVYSLATAIVAPSSTVAQLKRLREAVGDGEIDKLVMAAQQLRGGVQVPSVPTSRGASRRAATLG